MLNKRFEFRFEIIHRKSAISYDERILKVVKMTKSGNNINFVSSWGVQGTGAGKINSDIGIVKSGNWIFITDTSEDAIQKFTHLGAFDSESLESVYNIE